MRESKSDASSALSEVAHDLESQTASATSLQRTLAAVGDKRALLIEKGKDRTLITCNYLDVKYEFVHSHSKWKTRTHTCITRHDSDTKAEHDALIAEWELLTFGPDRLRLASSKLSENYFLARDYLKGGPRIKQLLTVSRSFEVNGRDYVWKSRLFSLDSSCKVCPIYLRDAYTSSRTTLQLYAQGDDEPMAIAHGSRYFFKSRQGYIEISRDEGILNKLVVTWAIFRQRRSEHASFMYNLIHSLLIDCLLFTLLHIYVWDKHG